MLCAVLVSGCSVFGIRSGYEQPRYQLVDQVGDSIEVRRYDPRVAAEVRVASRDLEDGRNGAFRLLFDYISGANRVDARLAMTAPVESAQVSEDIAMTAPVETAETGGGDQYMRFFLPAKYQREVPPEPLDERVQIVEVPAQTIAVLRFNGSRGGEAVAARTESLMNALAETSWRPVSPPVAYFYDPPWTLPMFRRNEVAVEIVMDNS